jgi:hypothetical protein
VCVGENARAESQGFGSHHALCSGPCGCNVPWYELLPEALSAELRAGRKTKEADMKKLFYGIACLLPLLGYVVYEQAKATGIKDAAALMVLVVALAALAMLGIYQIACYIVDWGKKKNS